jgi:hypothetical protein
VSRGRQQVQILYIAKPVEHIHDYATRQIGSRLYRIQLLLHPKLSETAINPPHCLKAALSQWILREAVRKSVRQGP